MLAYFFWDPSRAMFSFDLPLIGRPLVWYGFFFALGFLLGYKILISLLKRKLFPFPDLAGKSTLLAEKILFFIIAGTVIGARLGDVLFYQKWPHDLAGVLSIFKIWEGGLASHGAALGVLTALFLLVRKIRTTFPMMTYVSLLDVLVVPAGLVAGCIRIGNFWNQEILGKASTLPWAVQFGHPADGSFPYPRHPVQLYEATFYFFVFGVLWVLWRYFPIWQQRGKMSGLFIVLMFSFRFLIEFLKEEQSLLLMGSASVLDMAQYLSLPFIVLGTSLLLRTPQYNRHPTHQDQKE